MNIMKYLIHFPSINFHFENNFFRLWISSNESKEETFTVLKNVSQIRITVTRTTPCGKIPVILLSESVKAVPYNLLSLCPRKQD